jgi:hypothetical protein
MIKITEICSVSNPISDKKMYRFHGFIDEDSLNSSHDFLSLFELDALLGEEVRNEFNNPNNWIE